MGLFHAWLAAALRDSRAPAAAGAPGTGRQLGADVAAFPGQRWEGLRGAWP